MKITIACDSSADLSEELYKQNNIRVIPFPVMLGDKEYFDGVNLTTKMIFEHVSKTKELPKTSAISEEEYFEFFKKNQPKDGALIYICLSSKISSSFSHAEAATKRLNNVYAIDSLSLSSGIGVQVLYACRLRDKGETFENIIKKVEARRDSVQAGFITYKLDYLHKGGRCSSVQLLGANLLKIHPSIKLEGGKMIMDKKYMGKFLTIMEKYFIDAINTWNTPDNEVGFITFSSATDEMVKLAENITKENTHFKNLYFTHASATITSHCGENTIGILYYNDGDHAE